MPSPKTFLLGILGGAVGGVVGYFAFFWITQQGYYAMVLPGALIGTGAGLAARLRSTTLAGCCAVAAVGLGLFTEWKFRPFIVDGSLGYFLGHLNQLNNPAITLGCIGVGAVLAYFFSRSFARPR